jgi:hypothetical protein
MALVYRKNENPAAAAYAIINDHTTVPMVIHAIVFRGVQPSAIAMAVPIWTPVKNGAMSPSPTIPNSFQIFRIFPSRVPVFFVFMRISQVRMGTPAAQTMRPLVSAPAADTRTVAITGKLNAMPAGIATHNSKIPSR